MTDEQTKDVLNTLFTDVLDSKDGDELEAINSAKPIEELNKPLAFTKE